MWSRAPARATSRRTSGSPASRSGRMARAARGAAVMQRPRGRVLIRPKAGILDPQGEAVERALPALGFEGVGNVHVGRLVELDVEDPSQLRADVREAAREPARRGLRDRAAADGHATEVKFGVLRFPGSLRRGRRAARGSAGRRRRAALARRARPAGRRRDRRAGRLLLRRLPACRRDRALLAGDGVGDRVRAATAGWCSGSATASRCCARRACFPGALLPNANLRFTFRQVRARGRRRRTPPFTDAAAHAAASGSRASRPSTPGAATTPARQTLDGLEAARPGGAALRARRELQRLAARHRRRAQRARQRVRPDAPPRARGRRADAARPTG